MREPPTVDRLRSLRILGPQAPNLLVDLYTAATADETVLSDSDFLTVRDLVDVSGCDGPEVHALLLCMMGARGSGSLCVPLNEANFAKRMAFVVGAKAAETWASRVGRALAGTKPLSGLASIIERDVGEDESPLLPVIIRKGAHGDHAYFQRDYLSAMQLKRTISDRLHGGAPSEDAEAVAAALRSVLDEAPTSLAGNVLKLDEDQLRAVGVALHSPLCVVSGGPGTGKTSIVHTLLRVMVRLGYEPVTVRMAAPSGRAAQRMTDSLGEALARISRGAGTADVDAPLSGLRGMTIHRLLGYNPARDTYRHHAGNRVPVRALVIDEVSMVDVALMSKLLCAIPDDARVILLGDKDQLPSVGSGAVLADLMPQDAEPAVGRGLAAWLKKALGISVRPTRGAASTTALKDAVTVLKTNYRSQEHIRRVAAQIRTGTEPDELVMSLPVLPIGAGGEWPGCAALVLDGATESGGVWLCRHDGTPGSWRRVLHGWATDQYAAAEAGARCYRDTVRELASLKAEAFEGLAASADAPLLEDLFAGIDGARILTVLRNGPYGCVGVNEWLMNVLHAELDPGGRPSAFAGLPVMITRNEYALELYNGDVGALVATKDQDVRAVFRRSGRYITLPLEGLPEWEPAFATTVHKAQGSEYRSVLVSLPPEGGVRIMTREIIYTAITRARQLAVIHGTSSVLACAIARRVERDTGVGLFA
jgi:exodeoxyribonuclease V alpha subunit